MNGILSFTLGLETSNFLRGLGLASGGILSFAGAIKALQTGLGSFWNAIQDGGRLDDLSKRTGTTVSDLYQLEEAFKLVGLSADQVPNMILRVRQALGGVDEAGNRTDKAFSTLGLSMEDLAKADAPKQFELLSKALNSSGGSADSLAKMLFGSVGAGNMMQLARSSDDVAQSFRDTAVAAERMQRASGVFDTVGDNIQRLKTAMRGFWTNLAADAAPAISTMMESMTKAFRDGTITDLIVRAFVGAFEIVGQAAPAMFEMLGAALLKAFSKPLAFIQASLEFSIQKLLEQLMANKVTQVLMGGSALGIWAAKNGIGTGYKAESFSEIQKRWLESGPKFNVGSGEFGIDEITKDVQERLKKIKEELAKRFGILSPSSAPPSSTDDLNSLFSGGKNAGKEASVLEKMGFVMHGGGTGSRVENLLQRIVDNTTPLRTSARRSLGGGLTGLDTVS